MKLGFPAHTSVYLFIMIEPCFKLFCKLPAVRHRFIGFAKQLCRYKFADLIKDALVMPQAFIAAMAGEDAQEFRQRCVNIFQQADALDVMITSLQETAQALAKADQ